MNQGPGQSLLVALTLREWRGPAALPGKIMLAWAGLAFLAIVVVYLFNAPRFLLKTPAGRLSAWSWVWFWPYHLLSRLSLGLYRLFAREAPLHEVLPGLFLGSCLRRDEALKLCGHSPVSVLDLTSEFAECEPLRASGIYGCLPVLDHRAPSLEQLQRAVAFIVDQLPEHRVFVHCAVGHGRSATCVAAFLLANGLARSPEDAVALLKSLRPGVRLNRGQMRVLRQFHHSLRADHERRSV